MILKSLRLRNIRSYTDQVISFPIGSTLLAGDIGSGKSSILHSVEFALFGARRDSISGEALLRKGENDGEVELNLDLDGRDVTIKRRLRRQRGVVAQDSGFIQVGSSRTEGTATELKSRVLDLLGYPGELVTKSKSLIYRYTVYTPQEEMKRILFESDELRIDTLRKVFGIDRYKRIAGNAQLFVRSIKERKKELAGMLHGLDEKQADLKVRKAELAKKELAKQQLLPMLSRVRKSREERQDLLRKVEEELAKLGAVKGRAQVCDARLQEIVRSRETNRKELEALGPQCDALKRKLENTFLEEKEYPPKLSVEGEIEAKENELADLSSRRAELAERKRSIIERLARIQEDHKAKSERSSVSAEKESLYLALLEELKDRETISSNIEEVNRRLKEAEGMISELMVRQKNSEALKQDISKLDTCPTCRQEVSEVHKRSIMEQEDRKLEKAKAELDDLLGQKRRIVEELEACNKRLEALNEKERKLAATKVELDNLGSVKKELAKISELRASLDREKERIISDLESLDDSVLDRLRKDIREKKSLLKEIDDYDMLLREKKHNLALLSERQKRRDDLLALQDRLKQEVRGINAEKLELKKELSVLPEVEERAKNARDDVDAALEEEKDIEVRLGGVNKEIEGIASFVESLEKDVRQKLDAKEDLERLGGVQEWLERMFINLMTAMERQVMARAHTQFSELFSTWFNLLVEDDSISVRLDDSFSPVITQNGYETDVNHLSGGEKTSVALAYRLALNRVINDIVSLIKTRDIIMLDEPTDGFSSEQLDRVRSVLEELDVRQTIIVSHESKIESFVDSIIRIRKDDHVSRVVS